MSEVLFTKPKPKPKRKDVNGSPNQVFDMDNYVAHIINAIESKNIDVLAGVDVDYTTVKIHHHAVQHSPQGDPTHITHCPTNTQGEFSMVSIDIKVLDHFRIIDKKVDLHES